MNKSPTPSPQDKPKQKVEAPMATSRRPKWLRLSSITKICLGVFGIEFLIGGSAELFGIPVRELVRDPAAEYGFPVYGGAFSTIGLVILGAASILLIVGSFGISSPLKRVMQLGGVLSACMTIDDAFMLHEQVLPGVFGISEYAVYLMYFCGALYLYVETWRIADAYLLSAAHAAAFFLCVSVTADVSGLYGGFAFWFEDFAKLSGYVAILAFAIHAARRNLQTAPPAEN
ncbi:hypothetical protein V8J82_15500 [Gymnodinialimonas sp. 2305UL16-5]|uniref:hypothetical protein n=1 Tax=Gymnodinialimonas mytili TaxID=3126503 RepID=UPI0030A4ABC4